VVIREVVEEVVDFEEGRVLEVVEVRSRKSPRRKLQLLTRLGGFGGRGGYQQQSFGPPAQVLGRMRTVDDIARV